VRAVAAELRDDVPTVGAALLVVGDNLAGVDVPVLSVFCFEEAEPVSRLLTVEEAEGISVVIAAGVLGVTVVLGSAAAFAYCFCLARDPTQMKLSKLLIANNFTCTCFQYWPRKSSLLMNAAFTPSEYTSRKDPDPVY
jgi:hypothetical protein